MKWLAFYIVILISYTTAIAQNGRVGLNTTNPQSILHIVRNGLSGGTFDINSLAIMESNVHSFLQFSNTNNTEAGLLSGNAVTPYRSGIVFGIDSSIFFRTGGNNNRIKIAGNGNVGVGTTSPLLLFHVAKNTLFWDGNTYAFAVTNYNNPNLRMSMGYDDVIDAGIIQASHHGVSFKNILLNPSSGNIGIGTTSAMAKLHVHNGAILYTGNVGGTPVAGAGSRLMWIPEKSAFRVGTVDGAEWDNDSISIWSVAMGYNAVANNEHSISIGSWTRATGYYSLAMGKETLAVGNTSSAFGYRTIASGYYSTTFGEETLASNERCMAMGYQTEASGSNSVAIGKETKAVGPQSTAMGRETEAIGGNSIAMGEYTIASGSSSLAVGSLTTATGANSFSSGGGSKAIGHRSMATGHYTTSKSYAGTVIGIYNDTTNAADPYNPNPNNRLFQIGNGTTSNLRGNAMTVLQNGNIGIGTTTPVNLLEVAGRIRIRNGTGGTAGIYLNKNNNNSETGFIGTYADDNYIGMYGASGAGWNFLMNTVNGNIGIGTAAPSEKLNVVGNGLFTGTVTANCGVLVCSDIRYKTNILPITNALGSLLTLHGIYYNWDLEKFPENEFTDDRQIGFSAQEIEAVYPEMVKTDSRGYKTVDYSRLAPVLVEAIKEQQKEIEELKAKVELLLARMQ